MHIAAAPEEQTSDAELASATTTLFESEPESPPPGTKPAAAEFFVRPIFGDRQTFPALGAPPGTLQHELLDFHASGAADRPRLRVLVGCGSNGKMQQHAKSPADARQSLLPPQQHQLDDKMTKITHREPGATRPASYPSPVCTLNSDDDDDDVDGRCTSSSSSTLFSVATAPDPLGTVRALGILLLGAAAALCLPAAALHYDRAELLLDAATLAAAVLACAGTRRAVWTVYGRAQHHKRHQKHAFLGWQHKLWQLDRLERYQQQQRRVLDNATAGSLSKQEQEGQMRQQQQRLDERAAIKKQLFWHGLLHKVYFTGCLVLGSVAVLSPLVLGSVMTIAQEAFMFYGKNAVGDALVLLYVAVEAVHGLSRLAHFEIEGEDWPAVQHNEERSASGSPAAAHTPEHAEETAQSEAEKSIVQLDRNVKELAGRLITNENVWEEEIDRLWKLQNSTAKNLKVLISIKQSEQEQHLKLNQQLQLLQQQQQQILARLQDLPKEEPAKTKEVAAAADAAPSETHSMIRRSSLSKSVESKKKLAAAAIATSTAAAAAAGTTAKAAFPPNEAPPRLPVSARESEQARHERRRSSAASVLDGSVTSRGSNKIQLVLTIAFLSLWPWIMAIQLAMLPFKICSRLAGLSKQAIVLVWRQSRSFL